MKKYFVITVVIALAGISNAVAQLDHEATRVDVTTPAAPAPEHLRQLYESGHNKTQSSTEAEVLEEMEKREVRDSVTVTSVMNYFVMPDKFFNPGYFAQNDFAATNLTSSQFIWTMYSNYQTSTTTPSGTLVTSPPIAPQSANAGVLTAEPPIPPSSPWVKVTWGTVGQFSLVMAEKPTGVLGDCDGAPSMINVAVIAKPTIRFDDHEDYGGDGEDCEDSDEELFLTVCTDPEGTPDTTNPSGDIENWNGKDPRTIMFPVEVTTQSGNVRVDYILTFTPLGTTTPITFTKRENQWVSAGNNKLPLNIVHADIVTASGGTFTSETPAYGSYNIELLRVTDHISRKSDVEGDVLTGTDKILGSPEPCGSKNKFTYIILPKPKPGRTFHVPNFFNATP